MRWLCKLWPALDAITRRDGETYLSEYIPRVAMSDLAKSVKLADIYDNLSRKDGVMPESYTLRLKKARRMLAAKS